MAFLFENRKNFRGLNLSDLSMDEAYLNVSSKRIRGDPYYLYGINEDCYGCPLKRIREMSSEGYSVDVLSTKYPWIFRFRSEGSETYASSNKDLDPFEICEKKLVMEEFGVYDLVYSNDTNPECAEFVEAYSPVNPNLPLMFYTAVFFTGMILYFFSKFLRRKIRTKLRKSGDESEVISSEDNNRVANRNRVLSLDTFRGIAIALMIFVNDGGGGYYFMEHSTWNGLYVADLAFPWFMWIMGFCIPLSLQGIKKRKTHVLVVLKDVARRSVILFLLGFIWGNNGWINIEKLRIPGVLQRFALCYMFVGSTLVLLVQKMRLEQDKGIFRDIFNLWPRWIIALLVIGIHTSVTFLLHVPNCPTGYLGPGGLDLFPNIDDNTTHCIGGASGYLDRLILSPNHIYSNPTVKAVYRSSSFDPEGILGSLTSIFQVFLGAQGGFILVSFKKINKTQVLLRFILWGLGSVLIGGFLCGFSIHEGPIPMNKNLWSLSYVFVTSGSAFLLLASLYLFLDILSIWNGAPFLFAGMNSILLYLGHSTAWAMLPFHYAYPGMETHFDRLTESLWGVTVWLIVAFVLYKKGIFIKV